MNLLLVVTFVFFVVAPAGVAIKLIDKERHETRIL